MPFGNADPGNFVRDGACTFPTSDVLYSTQTLYWAATAGDQDGYPNVPRILEGVPVMRHPASYSLGRTGFGIAGFRFNGSFSGSATPRPDPKEQNRLRWVPPPRLSAAGAVPTLSKATGSSARLW
jgi:hypothetical protein